MRGSTPDQPRRGDDDPAREDARPGEPVRFELVLLVSPEVVRARLLALPHEWRDSKLPPTLRERGYLDCQVWAEGPDIVVHLVRPRGAASECVLQLQAADGPGVTTVVRGMTRRSRSSRRFRKVLLPFALAWVVLAVIVVGWRGLLLGGLAIGLWILLEEEARIAQAPAEAWGVGELLEYVARHPQSSGETERTRELPR
jgi:hypothetical protein